MMGELTSFLKDSRYVEIYENEVLLKSKDSQQVVSIDRQTFVVTKRRSDQRNPGSDVCVYGKAQIKIFSSKVFRIEKFCYIPLDKGISITNSNNIPFAEQDRTYIEMLEDFFSKKFLFFSYEYNLTCTLQTACDSNFERGKPKSQYFFNEIHLKDFINNGLGDWVLPVISGLVEIKRLTIRKTDVDFILISRRDKRRSGMRYISRGCDYEGNASNTVDTEQIFVITNTSSDYKVFSYVQLRGSIPIFWEQKQDLRWEPKAEMSSDVKNLSVAKKHFDKISKDYGSQILVNLVDKKKTQQKLGLEYKRVVEDILNFDEDGDIESGQVFTENHLRYIWFDFHAECRKMKYENLSKLLALVDSNINELGFFEADIRKNNNSITSNIIRRQNGTFRVNCMDCLDRTNVVQSVFARKLLHFVLIHAKLSDKSLHDLKPFETLPGQLEDVFREAWTNNADALSILYTGTGALKTDFTRTGKRTTKGALCDGKNALVRYVKNHFYDGYNQTCVDLVLGKYIPKEKEYQKKKLNSFFILAFALLVIPFLFMIMNSINLQLFGPNTHSPEGRLKNYVLNGTIIGILVFFFYKAIFSNPEKLIEKPVVKH